MSRRVAAVASVIERQIRNRELRDRVGQAQKLAEDLTKSPRSGTFRDVVANGIFPSFLKHNGLELQDAVAVFLPVRQQIEEAMGTEEDAMPVYNVNVSGVVGPVNVLGNQVKQSQVIYAGNSDWLRGELRKLGFDDEAAETQVRRLDSLTSAERTVPKAKKLALMAASAGMTFVATAGATGIGGLLTTLFLQYLGLQ